MQNSILYKPTNNVGLFLRSVFLLGFVFVAALPQNAFSQPNDTGLDERCKDGQYAKTCPETCAAQCANAGSSADVSVCIGVLRAIRNGAKDQPSCRQVRNPASARKPVPVEIAEKELRSLCIDQNFARACPESCDRFCTDDDPTEEQIGICRQIIQVLSTGGKDRKSCHRQASNYTACKERVAEFFKEFQPPPAPEGSLETVYEDRPGCATPLKKLLANFVCLRDESSHISAGVRELDEEGLSGIDDIERLCSLEQNDLSYFTGLSERLIDSGKNLKREFETLESCRKDLIEWNTQLKTACSNSDVANCTTIVEKLANARQPMMDKITQLASAMEGSLDKVEQELGSIRFFRNASLDCPPSDPGEGGELTIEQILGSP
uniref:Uncharacterized protein n=1 Tax=Candidatus Kentrum sp. FM TaxID=2126340 RepID=A0A450SJ77_9GAMM|nr:MAG: hypothetical protein BECKFM1743C_GA0114222_100149 [Candidatus Kentron sp. FM]VFJ53509.1 MAG: hypothetical protein BECKFM1743A_GA0114220_101159 [Candidatus Kentron sp. FM]VFK06334.1 MAG: hypothetical protein BECKFM1743B_GA0114221_100149 [Candidatus Kentron sp. FM]